MDPQKGKKKVKTGGDSKAHKHEGEGDRRGGDFVLLMYQAKINGHDHDENVNA